jgi:hypothetical protein
LSGARGTPTVIDFHAHFMTPEVFRPVELVQSAAKIPAAARQAILGANAARLLGLDI